MNSQRMERKIKQLDGRKIISKIVKIEEAMGSEQKKIKMNQECFIALMP